MNTLMTRKLVFGMLMTLVLAFSVQGIADALTFRESRTGDLQTVILNNEFTISLSVTLGSNTTRITDDTGKLIKDGTATGGGTNARIDSSGYLVFVASDNRDYRTSTEANALSNTHVRNADNTYTAASGTLYVSGGSNITNGSKSNGNVVDDSGAAVYIRSGTGPNFTYSRATAAPDARVPDLNRYHYNEEAISISVPTGTTLTQVGSYRISTTAAHTMDEQRNSMNEDKLTSSIRLTYRADKVGEKIITITDTTDKNDRPGDPSQPLSFTIFVVPAYDGTTVLALAGTGTDGYETRNDNADPRVDELFGETGANATNAPIIYSVSGSGRLYVERIYGSGDGTAQGSPTSKSTPTQTLSTSNAAQVYLDMNGSSNKVSAYVRDQNAAETRKTIIFIFNYAAIEILSGDDQTGVPNSRLIDPLGIRVKDAKGRAISGLAVTFTPTTGKGSTLQPVIGTDVYLTTTNTWADTFKNIDRTVSATATVPTRPITADTAVMVPTDRSGEAKVYLKLGEAGNKTVNVSAGGGTARFYLTSSASTDIPTLEILSGNSQSSASDGKVADPLVVRVLASNDQPLPTQEVTFTTTKGYLTTTPGYELDTSPMNGPATQVKAQTDVNGKASVGYDLVNHSGAADVIAEIQGTGSAPYQRRVTFNINGGGSQPPQQPPQQQPQQPPTATTFTVSPSSITGTAGSTQPLTVTTPPGSTAQVGNVVFGEFLNAGGSALPVTGTGTFTSTLTLPSTTGTFDLIVSIGGDRRTVPVTVSSAPAPGAQTGATLSLRIEPGSGAPGTSSIITVTATDENGPVENVSVSLAITPGGGTLSPPSVTTGTNGTALSVLTRGSTPGTNYFITATASGYTFRSVLPQGERVVISGTPPTTTTPPGTPGTTTRAPAGDPDTIDIYDGDQQSGPLNVQLPDAFVVEVLDGNGTPVQNVRVGFDVTQGSGRLSPRSVRTDASGFAEVNFTPTSAGEIVVRARVAGVDFVEFTVTAGDPPESLTIVSGDNQTGNPGSRLANALVVEVRDADGDPIEGIRVTFSVTAGGGRLSETSATTNAQGRAQTSLTLGSERAVNSVQASVTGVDPITLNTSIDAVIHVAAANRPVMYWIDGGALYRLAGAKAQQIAPSANDVVVDAAGGKIYYIEGTSATTGRIHSVNVDGTGATVVKVLTSVPMGLTHDSTSGKLYLTNSWGKIQRMNADGSQFETNFIVGLGSPHHIAVGGGNVYWTDANRNVRAANIVGDKTPRTIATSPGAIGGLVVSGNTVYWTEQTGNTTGRIRSVNFNGGPHVAADLFTLTAVPHGIAVDGNTVYWANGWGKVQRRNVDRSKFQDLVTGLMAPGAVAVGGANVATPTPTPTPTPQQPTTVKSKYDVNNDGTVDNVDVGIVVAAVLSGSNQASLDVNGDGKVDLSDVVAVSQNVDNSGAAAAPALRTRLSSIQVDRIQEQIDLLLGMNDRSPGALYTLAYLQNLLAMARPEKTQLLANYPNPFNPETWIPYELATDTNVKLTIYNAQGVVVRTLELGHQTAGYYTGRDRAAYWDGRNSFGELVASGLYFYQLETDKTSSMRKMVILK